MAQGSVRTSPAEHCVLIILLTLLLAVGSDFWGKPGFVFKFLAGTAGHRRILLAQGKLELQTAGLRLPNKT